MTAEMGLEESSTVAEAAKGGPWTCIVPTTSYLGTGELGFWACEVDEPTPVVGREVSVRALLREHDVIDEHPFMPALV